MSYRISAQADEEIDAIILYLNKRRENLGWRFFDKLLDECSAIAKNPLRCPAIGPQHRRCLMLRFQYLIVYEPTPNPLIVSVYHHARHQDNWRSR